VDRRAKRSHRIAQAGIIAASYAALTLLCLGLLQGLAWGPVQLRVSEALTVLALFTPAAIPGLTIGCILANLLGMAINGSGPVGLLDVVFGSLATCLGAIWMWHFRSRQALALLGPVAANALIIAAYLPVLLAALGFYTIPFTNISLSGSWPAMYAFGAVAIAIGEALVVYALGWPLASALKKSGLVARLQATGSSVDGPGSSPGGVDGPGSSPGGVDGPGKAGKADNHQP